MTNHDQTTASIDVKSFAVASGEARVKLERDVARLCLEFYGATGLRVSRLDLCYANDLSGSAAHLVVESEVRL